MTEEEDQSTKQDTGLLLYNIKPTYQGLAD